MARGRKKKRKVIPLPPRILRDYIDFNTLEYVTMRHYLDGVRLEVARNKMPIDLRLRIMDALSKMPPLEFIYCSEEKILICRPYNIRGLHAMARKFRIGRDSYVTEKNELGRPYYKIPVRRRADIEARCHRRVSFAVLCKIMRSEFHGK